MTLCWSHCNSCKKTIMAVAGLLISNCCIALYRSEPSPTSVTCLWTCITNRSNEINCSWNLLRAGLLGIYELLSSKCTASLTFHFGYDYECECFFLPYIQSKCLLRFFAMCWKTFCGQIRNNLAVPWCELV